MNKKQLIMLQIIVPTIILSGCSLNEKTNTNIDTLSKINLQANNSNKTSTATITNGTITWDGGEYTGDLMEEVPDGEGELTFSNGAKYVGHFVNGEKQGTGTFYDVDGEVFTGEWSNDDRNGYGNSIWEKGDYAGDKYEGQWVNGNREGQGTYTYKDGSIYEGEFKDGDFHGKGKLTYSDGSYLEGEWEHNNLIKDTSTIQSGSYKELIDFFYIEYRPNYINPIIENTQQSLIKKNKGYLEEAKRLKSELHEKAQKVYDFQVPQGLGIQNSHQNLVTALYLLENDLDQLINIAEDNGTLNDWSDYYKSISTTTDNVSEASATLLNLSRNLKW